MPAQYAGRSLDHPSDRDKAVSLAYFRFMTQKSNNGGPLPRWARMTDQDRELLLWAAHNEKWTGVIDDGASEVSLDRAKLSAAQIKTLLDDSTSGGIEITPVVFDDALILTPILYGELFPFVDVRTIARGRRVKGGTVTNPEFTSGIGEGTAITPFNTASFVGAFDTAIFAAVAAIELGQDFEEDTPVDLGGQIVEQFGLKAMEWLDRVVAVGNGYDEPQGFFSATAATLLNSTFGAAGRKKDYEVFMALANHIGHDKRGITTYVRDAKGFEVVEETEESVKEYDDNNRIIYRTQTSRRKVVDDNTLQIAQAFRQWYSEQG
jgi:HK97 family phage major capsid protein